MKLRHLLLAALGLVIVAGSVLPANAQDYNDRQHHRHHRHHHHHHR